MQNYQSLTKKQHHTPHWKILGKKEHLSNTTELPPQKFNPLSSNYFTQHPIKKLIQRNLNLNNENYLTPKLNHHKQLPFSTLKNSPNPYRHTSNYQQHNHLKFANSSSLNSLFKDYVKPNDKKIKQIDQLKQQLNIFRKVVIQELKSIQQYSMSVVSAIAHQYQQQLALYQHIQNIIKKRHHRETSQSISTVKTLANNPNIISHAIQHSPHSKRHQRTTTETLQYYKSDMNKPLPIQIQIQRSLKNKLSQQKIQSTINNINKQPILQKSQSFDKIFATLSKLKSTIIDDLQSTKNQTNNLPHKTLPAQRTPTSQRTPPIQCTSPTQCTNQSKQKPILKKSSKYLINSPIQLGINVLQ